VLRSSTAPRLAAAAFGAVERAEIGSPTLSRVSFFIRFLRLFCSECAPPCAARLRRRVRRADLGSAGGGFGRGLHLVTLGRAPRRLRLNREQKNLALSSWQRTGALMRDFGDRGRPRPNAAPFSVALGGSRCGGRRSLESRAAEAGAQMSYSESLPRRFASVRRCSRGCSIATRVFGGSEWVSHTLPPTTQLAPTTVSPPRIVAFG